MYDITSVTAVHPHVIGSSGPTQAATSSEYWKIQKRYTLLANFEAGLQGLGNAKSHPLQMMPMVLSVAPGRKYQVSKVSQNSVCGKGKRRDVPGLRKYIGPSATYMHRMCRITACRHGPDTRSSPTSWARLRPWQDFPEGVMFFAETPLQVSPSRVLVRIWAKSSRGLVVNTDRLLTEWLE
jgi:hypothetical protein